MATGLQKVGFEGGVNIFKDPMDIPDNQLQASPNFCARAGEEPGVRPSMSSVREIAPDYRAWNSDRYDAGSSVELYNRWAKNWRPMRFLFPPFGGDVCGVFQAVGAQQITNVNADGTVTPTMLAVNDAVLWMLPSLYAGGDPSGSTAVGGPYCVNLGNCTRAPSLFVFNGIIYAFGGSKPGAYIEPATDGPIGPTLGWTYRRADFGVGNENFVPQQAAIVRDRAIYSIGPRLWFSDRNDPLSISTPGSPADGTRDIFVSGEEVEDVTALAELSTSADGSPVQSVACAWTRTHCYMLLGEPTETTDTATNIIGSLQINRLNIEAGCVSQATITRTPYGTFWVGADDVWFMPFGNLPIRVGTNIRPAIKAVPAALQYRICAEYEGGFLRIALSGDGGGMTGTSALDQQWWLNLNEGPPGSADQAQWWGPMNIVNEDSISDTGTISSGIWAFARDIRATGDGKLYSLQPFIMDDLASGEHIVYGMTLCGWDQYTGHDVGAPQLSPRAWQANTVYYEGDMIVPAHDGSANFRTPAWLCTTAGTSHAATEPSWMASVAASITDGTVVWKPRYFATGKVLASYRPVSDDGPNGNYTAKGYNAVEPVILSKEYTLGDVMTEKMLDGAELAYWAQLPVQATYSTSPNQETRSRVLGYYDPTVGAAVLGTAAFNKQKRRKLLTPDPTKRFNALTAIAQVQFDAGFVIETGYNDTLTAQPFGDLTIAAGYYASLTDLWLAVKAASVVLGFELESYYEADGSISRAAFGMRLKAGGALFITSTLLSQLFGYFSSVGATSPSYCVGTDAPQRKPMTNLQVAGLNLRFRQFNRRPT